MGPSFGASLGDLLIILLIGKPMGVVKLLLGPRLA